MIKENRDFSPVVFRTLRDAGWYAGRSIGEVALDRWRAELVEEFGSGEFAREILLEFGNIEIPEHGAGVDVARQRLEFDPTLAVGEGGRFHEFCTFLQSDIYPLGECNGFDFLAISSDGKLLSLGDSNWVLGNSFLQGVETLVLGLVPAIRSPSGEFSQGV